MSVVWFWFWLVSLFIESSVFFRSFVIIVRRLHNACVSDCIIASNQEVEFAIFFPYRSSVAFVCAANTQRARDMLRNRRLNGDVSTSSRAGLALVCGFNQHSQLERAEATQFNSINERKAHLQTYHFSDSPPSKFDFGSPNRLPAKFVIIHSFFFFSLMYRFEMNPIADNVVERDFECHNARIIF